MIETFQDFLQDFARSFGLRDLLDVALVSIILYVILGWLRRELSRNMLVAVVVLFGVYAITRLLQLYLFELVFRGLFFLILLAIVIVFQADIRRLVERIGLWITGGRMSTSRDRQVVDLLVEATENLAERRTGALIAIRGREEWERLIDGGIEHGGKISLPLLYSLFNPTSPAHDGAVLLEGSRITRFGAHLPLSKNLAEVGDHGTRHTAALGLAEACDALVIVVSEEHGTISLAHDGRLLPIETASDLKGHLESFWEQKYEAKSDGALARWNAQKLRTALLAVVLAMLAWLLFVFEPGLVYRTLTVPVELRNLPAEWSLDEPSPSEVRITLAGPQAAFQLLDVANLTLSLDLSNIREGVNQFVVEESGLAIPADMELYDAEPEVVTIEAERLQPVRARVRLQTVGTLPDSVELAGYAVEPDTVDVLVPRGAVQWEVLTDTINLSSINQSTSLTTRLVRPERARWPDNESPEVTVRFQTRPRD